MGDSASDEVGHDASESGATDWDSLPVGMTPRFGFDAIECDLLDSEDVATVAQVSAEDGGSVETGGRLRLGFTVKPTPRLTWSFDPRDTAESSICADEAARLRCRLPHAPELELRHAVTGWRLTAAESLSGLLPAYEPEGEVDVRDVRFSVLNWGGVLGTTYTRYDAPQQMTLNRHQWSSGGWQITLDADPDLKLKWKDAKDNREFIVTHCGRLTRTDDQPFQYRDIREVLQCLHWFLSFVRGRRVGIALASGFVDDPGRQPQEAPLITHWDVTQVDEAATAQSWFTLGVEHELEALFQSFHCIWRKDQPLARQLRTMISTYCVALSQSIPIEMQVLSGYIGLETETDQNLDKLKLRSILASNSLPDRISDTVHGSGQEFSGSKQLAKTRNDIVHQNTGSYPTFDKFLRASKTCLYFLELLILRKLGHDGTFCDRFRARSVGERSDLPSTGGV